LTKSRVEYADYQITVYPPPCPYRCRYCFWSTPLLRARAEKIRQRFSFERSLGEAKILLEKKSKFTVVISFTTDPYPLQEAYSLRTRKILEILQRSKHRVMILTKNPVLALRDLDLMKEGDFWFGTTITTLSATSRILEPEAPDPMARIEALRKAKESGLKTWISIEPIIPGLSNVARIVEETIEFTDFYVLGKLNYARQLGFQDFTREEYRNEVKPALKLLKEAGTRYFIKKELLKVL